MKNMNNLKMIIIQLMKKTKILLGNLIFIFGMFNEYIINIS